MARIRLFSLARKRNLLVKLTAFILIISLTPLLIMSVLIYQNMRMTMQQELQSANLNYLKQTVNAVEIVTNQISESFRRLPLDSNIREFENFTRGSYYESLSGDYKPEDQPGLYAYLNSKYRLVTNIQILKQSNDYIYSVYMVDQGKRMILTSDNIQYNPDNFYDKEWNVSLKTLSEFPTVMDIRESKARDGGSKAVIPVFFTLSIPGNYLIVNLDVDSIYNSIVSKLDIKLGNSFFVMSETGQMMLYDGRNELNVMIGADHNFLELLDTKGESSSYEHEYKGRKMLVTTQKSDSLGWTFVTAAALDELYKSVSTMSSMIILICFLLVAATGLFAVAATRNLYNPVRHLLQFINKNVDPDSHKVDPDQRELGEFGTIRGSLEAAFEDRRSLQIRLKEGLPANQEKFIHMIIRKHSLAVEDISERLKFLSLDLKLEGIALMLISPEESDRKGKSVENEKLRNLKLVDIVESHIPEERKRIVMEFIEDMFIVLVNCTPHDFSDNFQLAKHIIHQAEEHLGIRCSIGIGEYCEDIFTLGKSYEQAKEALRYRSMTGSCEVIYIEDVRLEGTPLFIYPKDREAMLIHSLINGDLPEAMQSYREMMKEIRAYEGRVHYHQIKHAFIQLLGRFVATAGEMRADMNTLLQEKDNLFSLLLQKNDWNEIMAWFEEIIKKLSDHIGNAFREKNNRHIVEAMRILEADCGGTISLSTVAEKLGLNPSYLSRIFKEDRGETFSEYLTRNRIERSKRMIAETDMKIKEVGEHVGYYKTNYFIKLFKEYTGMTPGEYRSLKLASGDKNTPAN
ncbi:helix-turn-helix domain-containing protein [Paenibacillus nasutitermitis]|uniref:HTH araC/xylS-type domain-containing protein n=1 Tax=Paenibacillus nasutitermitis TaxID=1652958 RepID=A0A916YM53_9BACL|nr:helix-turn-helix domain-containing protein [Paenibacillus nasutitermitis]GGD51855.1 hypothetical protein GCM10010911_06770 [Paenibacillus nasutitermitis]